MGYARPHARTPTPARARARARARTRTPTRVQAHARETTRIASSNHLMFGARDASLLEQRGCNEAMSTIDRGLVERLPAIQHLLDGLLGNAMSVGVPRLYVND